MNQLIAYQPLTPTQLQIIKRSYARDTDDDEFNRFVEQCRLLNLSPIKGQISARVYNKNDPKKRSMVVIVQIGGLRAVAARQGDYLPDDSPPVFTYNAELKNADTNPLGIESAVVKAYRMVDGVKHTCVGVAYWDEYAPIEDVWGEDEATGRRAPSGKKKLAANWLKMPRVMLAKCAEAQALRKGWPEDLSSVFSEEEMESADIIEGSATEVLQQVAAEDRMRKLGSPKHGYAIQWELGEPLETIASGVIFDRIAAYARDPDMHLLKLRQFRAVNRESFARYWADMGNDALELKRMLDNAEEALKTKEQA